MSKVVTLAIASWSGTLPAGLQESGITALEGGDVLFLPGLQFAVQPRGAPLLAPSILGSSKNASFDPTTGRLGGTSATGADAELLRGFIRRFSAASAQLVEHLLPRYRGQATRGRASFRPAEI